LTKFLMWIVLGVLGLLAWKALSGRSKSLRRDDGKAAAQSGPTKSSAPSPDQGESMQRCAHCGVHFPASEAVMADGGVYCSAAHRDRRGDSDSGTHHERDH
jgi:uncharacterized protein